MAILALQAESELTGPNASEHERIFELQPTSNDPEKLLELQPTANDAKASLELQATQTDPETKPTQEEPAVADAEPVEETLQRDLFGFVEMEYFREASGKKQRSKFETIKFETRLNLKTDLKWHGAEFHGDADLYVYPGPEDDIKNPQTEGRPELRQAYFKAGETTQARAGIQAFQWGVADNFRVTNYLDQNDLRELFAKDRADRTKGVPALSFKQLLGDFALEAGITPLHNPTLFPPKDSYWEFIPNKANLVVLQNGLPPAFSPAFYFRSPFKLSRDFTWEGSGMSQQNIVAKPNLEKLRLPRKGKNASGALRFGGTIGRFDAHLYYFNGIDRNILLRPSFTFAQNASGTYRIDSIQLNPVQAKVESGGADVAFTLDKLSIRAEASYTPKKNAVQRNSQLDQTKLLQIPHLAYSVGFDYNLRADTGFFLAEWFESRYLKHEKSIVSELFTDILFIGYRDAFLDSKILVTIGAFIRPVGHGGTLQNTEFGYDFQNGLTAILGAQFFLAKRDPLLSPYRDHDYAYFRVRMNF